MQEESRMNVNGATRLIMWRNQLRDLTRSASSPSTRGKVLPDWGPICRYIAMRIALDECNCVGSKFAAEIRVKHHYASVVPLY